MARYLALAERSVIVSSFGKSYHVTGWCVGFTLALGDASSYLGLGEFYRKKHDLLAEALAGSRFELCPSAGSFFMLARFGAFSDESDSDFVLRLIRETRVATIPLSTFYNDGTDNRIIRLSFAKDDDTLREGARRLCAV